jgi:hypothetical protein
VRSIVDRVMSFNFLVAFLVTGIVLMVLYLSYIALFPFRTLDVKNQPLPIINSRHLSGYSLPTIKAGDTLIYKSDYCRYTRVPSTLVRTIIGPTVITIAQDNGTSDTGCHTVEVANTVIPSYAPPGIYYLKISVCFQVTALQNKCQKIRTEDFEVVK